MFKTFGIIGHQGMVGNALLKWLSSQNKIIYGYDIKDGIEEEKKKVANSEIIFICVPTPYQNGINLNAVRSSIIWINNYRKKNHYPIVVIKSTVLPTTTEKLQKEYSKLLLMMNPEFLTEVTAYNDMSFPDRQILGVTRQSYQYAKKVLMSLPLAPYEAIVTSTEAEVIKYFGNNWFVFKVLIANQFYEVCKSLKIDYEKVKDAVAADKRIERTHLTITHKGGRGASGGCLPKDFAASIEFMKKLKLNTKLFEVAKDFNDKLCYYTGKIDTKNMYNFKEEIYGRTKNKTRAKTSSNKRKQAIKK